MLDMAQECLNLKFMCCGLIVAVAILITLCDAQCSQDTDGVYRYGPGCAFMCHCVTSEQCDFNTGECQSGCDFDWVGPGCQYKNIAVGQISRHIDNKSPNRYSIRAVDRSLSTCSYTGDENTPRSRSPWWKVWLPYNFTMRQMEILTLDSHRRFFDGFKVIVEYVPENQNTNITYYPDQSQICYTHNDTTLKDTSETVTCDKYFTGNQVRIQLSSKRTQLVLCDVRIYGGRNFAFERIAKQSSVTEDSISLTTAASRAVDGKLQSHRLDMCSVTKTEDEPWWTVDLNHLVSIVQVSIFSYTEEQGIGYKIFASNSTDDFNLVRSIDVSSQTTIDVSVKSIFRVIKITTLQTQKRIAICEVQVYGDCLDDVCGYNCNKVCHCKNITAKDKITGICSNGCTGRWSGKGDTCDIKCDVSQWGETCQNKCVQCRQTEPCNVVTGKCQAGCEDGYKNTDLCNNECEDGTYGQNCKSSCSGNCKNKKPCKKSNGHCPDGCAAGYIGDRCDERCPQGLYGTDCKGYCSVFCTGGLSSCTHVNGSCSRGCLSGYEGLRCEKECEDGKYGQNCVHVCSAHCKNNVLCHKQNGSCQDGCKPGYTGELCDKDCQSGYYGQECKEKCNDNCSGDRNDCDKVYGTCSNGCDPGWIGRTCEEACPNGRWGLKCINPCNNCLSAACRNTDGLCLSGCVGGIKDTAFCDEECDDGTYGTNCKEICSVNCNDVCSKTNGQCKSCKSGWQGSNCSTECGEGYWAENCMRICGKCMSGSCDRFHGACSENCQPGYKFTLHCDEECDTGWYGDNCTGQCSNECEDLSLCRKSDGVCLMEPNGTSMTAIIVGVGTALMVVVILGVLTILCYLRRTRNGAVFCTYVNKIGKPTNYGMAMSDVGVNASGGESVEMKEDTYDTTKERNVDEHVYDAQ